MRIWLAYAIIPLLFSAPLRADTYHRFWRGMRRPEMSVDQFCGSLNQVFIPATVRAGAGNGMIAYEPILTAGLSPRVPGLPDEIALVSYSSKNAYDALFSTPSGKAYAHLHWHDFDRRRSGSLVPEAFRGTVAFEHAYDFHPRYADWMKNQTTVLIGLRSAGEGDPAYLDRLGNQFDRDFRADPHAGVLDRAILVSKNYWIEYVSATHEVKTRNAKIAIHLQRADSSNARISSGSGLNLQF